MVKLTSPPNTIKKHFTLILLGLIRKKGKHSEELFQIVLFKMAIYDIHIKNEEKCC